MKKAMMILAAVLLLVTGCAYSAPGQLPDPQAVKDAAETAEDSAEVREEKTRESKAEKNQETAPGDDAAASENDSADEMSEGGETEEDMDEEMAMAAAMQPRADFAVSIGGRTFYPDLEDNSSVEALIKHLESEPLTVELSDYGNFEKVGDLPWDLPRNDETITTVPGDIILYMGNKITIYYDENTWDFTRIGRINGMTREELLEILGDGDVTAQFYLEWYE